MIGNRFKEARKKAGNSQKDVVEAVGITQSALSQLENGLISSSNLLSIAKYLGVDSYWLQTGIESNTNNFLNNKNESNVSLPTNPLCAIPLLDYVQAGLFHEVGYDGLNPLGTTWTTYEGTRPECVSLKVEGLSMAP